MKIEISIIHLDKNIKITTYNPYTTFYSLLSVNNLSHMVLFYNEINNNKINLHSTIETIFNLNVDTCFCRFTVLGRNKLSMYCYN